MKPIAQETQLVEIRNSAQLAWNNKDYSTIISLYEPFESVISEAEKKKLNLARKRVSEYKGSA